MRLLRLAPLGLLALSGHVGCHAGSTKEERVISAVARLDPTSGNTHRVYENGLSSNGLFQNGLFQNGLFQNGLFQNGLFQNGLLQSALWKDSVWQENHAALEVLRQNPHTREFLRYTYECAMPPSASVVLDPGATPEHVNLELHGLIGLAPEWGAADGTCNESCQRWVTACLLARTNAYGKTVEISMRVPDDDDTPEHIRKALEVSGPERGEYKLFEGAFYGNIFEQTQRHGVDVMTPLMYACSGAGSNTPEVTKRFNASPGAGGPIDVVGVCRKQAPDHPYSACEKFVGDEKEGAVKECYASKNPDRSSENLYREVISVYLKNPIATCNNTICEEGEAVGDGGACPSDCPGGWAKSFAGVLTQGSASSAQDHRLTMGSWSRLSALGPDNTIVLAGVAPGEINFGAEPLSPVGDGAAAGVLAKFAPGGTLQWSRRFDVDGRAAQVAVAVNPAPQDGRISVVLNERRGEYESGIRIVTFDRDGNVLWSKSFAEKAPTSSVSATALAVGPRGDLFITATLAGTMAFGSKTLTASPDSPREYVLNLSSDGNPVWDARFDQPGKPSLGARAIEVDSSSPPGVVVSVRHDGGGALWRLAPNGSTQWIKPGIYGGVAFGPDGDIYATGALEGEYGFTRPPSAQTGDLFVVRYNQESGAPTAVKTVVSSCSDPSIPCAYRWFTGRELAFTTAGELLVGVRGGRRSTIDLGGGPFRAYETEDLFVAAFAMSNLEPTWAKHLPTPLDITLRGMHLGVGVDGQVGVVVSGTFSGSTVVNSKMLVSRVPEQRSVGSTFLASFAVPKSADAVAPVIADGVLPEPSKPEVVEAISAAGAKVFFVPPLSYDLGDAGVSVTCSHAPNSVFPLGSTTVTCTASDPRGNKTSKEFTVKVADGGPVFAAPTPVVAEAAGAGTTPVFFDPPPAADLVDGALEVSCLPESGSPFPLGSSQVNCTAHDKNGKVAHVSFPVHVRYGGLTCGNGTLEPGEQCDDGDTDNEDGCTTTCMRTNRAPVCTGTAVSASPSSILASSTPNFWPIEIVGVSDPDGDPVTITAMHVWQDEPVSLLWCPGGTCADATLDPLTVRAERDTWAETDPPPDGRVYAIDFQAIDPQGAWCTGSVEVCVQRTHDIMSCGRGDLVYNSLDPWDSPSP